MKRIRNMFIMLAGCILAGTVLLALIYRIPIDRRVVTEAEFVLNEQNTTADYPVLKAWEQYFYSFRPGVFDGNSVSIIFSNATREVQKDYLKAAMVESYDWYWHGYVVLLRPLFFFLDYKDVEIFFSFLLLLIAVFLGAAIGKRKSPGYVWAFVSSFLLIMPMVVGLCLQYIWIALLSFGGVLVFLRFETQLSKKDGYLFFFLIMGALTSYLDLLTYPLFTWGIPVIWWLLLGKKGRVGRKAVLFVIFSAVAWGFGYVGMWAGKWLVGSVILHKNIFAEAFSQILCRSGILDSYSGSDRLLYRSGTADIYSLRERFYCIFKNWKHYSYGLYSALLLGWFLVFLFQSFRNGWKKSEKACALGLVAVSPLIWNMVAVNHMDVHHFFTYRTYDIMILSWIALILESIGETTKQKPDFKLQRLLSFVLLFLFCTVAAMFLKKISCEETEISNKGDRFVSYEYEELEMEMGFSPSYPRILRFCIALSSQSENCTYIVRVMEEGKLLYEEKIPIEHYQIFNYVLYPVDWKLKPGGDYTIRLTAQGNEKPVCVYISEEDMDYLPDIGPVTINGERLQGESCFGVVYWAQPFSAYLRLFILLSWMGVLLMVCYIIYSSVYSHSE